MITAFNSSYRQPIYSQQRPLTNLTFSANETEKTDGEENLIDVDDSEPNPFVLDTEGDPSPQQLAHLKRAHTNRQNLRAVHPENLPGKNNILKN